MKYLVKRSKRRKNIAIKVLPSGEVVVYAPQTSTDERIKKVVLSKYDWIEKHQKTANDRLNLLPRLNDGDKIYISGKIYNLSYHNKKTFYYNQSENCLYLPVNDAIGGLIAFIKVVFLPYIQAKTEYFAQKFSFNYKMVTISNCKRLWGVCSADNKIKYSLSVALIPEDLCDYIVLHELCHTVQKNHQKQFYCLLQSVLPNYKQMQIKLKKFNAYCRFLQK